MLDCGYSAIVLFHLQRSSAFSNEERLFERELRHIDDGLQTRLVALHGRYLGALSAALSKVDADAIDALLVFAPVKSHFV